MQKTVYICDHCQKEIGLKKHISLTFNSSYCGIAVPPGKDGGGWGIHQKLNNSFKHFCNGKCVGAFFTELMKKVK